MNAVSERPASLMCRIKNWLRSSMSQKRFNHCMLLSVNKEKNDEIKPKKCRQCFVKQMKRENVPLVSFVIQTF